jgi:hypothetical protein
MKKYLYKFLTLLFLLFCLDCTAQEKWDSENCMYTNSMHLFHWRLDSELKWRKVMPVAEHTVFAAQSPYGLYCFVNINPIDADVPKTPDIWKHFDKIREIQEYAMIEGKKQTGIDIALLEMDKCVFLGNNAIKKITKETKSDDVNDDISYALTYTFLKNKATWNITVSCSSDVYMELGEDGLKAVCKGFGFSFESREFIPKRALNENKKTEIEAQLLKFCKQLNQQLPVELDDFTVLQSVIYTNWVITALYTIKLDSELFTEAEKTKLMDELRTEMTKEIPTAICQGIPEFSTEEVYDIMKQTKLKVRYIYQDINSKTFGVIQWDYRDFLPEND